MEVSAAMRAENLAEARCTRNIELANKLPMAVSRRAFHVLKRDDNS